MDSLTIVTYGGGEILQKMFQAISMLFNDGHGGLMRPVMMICSCVGGVYAFSKAFFGSAGESIILGYFFPLIVISSILMIPSTTVHIEDVLRTSRAEGQVLTSSYSVNHVPWLLGKFAETVSTIGYNLAQAVESVMHMPGDANYNATGMIFGSEASLDISKYRLSNAGLEQNLRLFAKQCVLYDIALSRYSLDDIKKATDLWNFFEQKTSNVRMIRYCPPNSIGLDQCAYVSCKGAIEKMKPFFEKEKEHYAKLEIGKNLPLTFQALTGIQKESKELIGQQLTMNVLGDELSGGKFAKHRAYTQQQSTYRTMGSLAANGLVTMRIVFEALIYAVFIFVIPLSLTPGGIKYLINWAWLVIWLQMWPPLFAILNYIMQIAAHYKFDGWFTGLNATQKGLSFFTSIGMQNLNDEIFALAAFLSVSVPYISYILLKEGLSSFVQLAGSLMSPAQQAAGSAASEQVSGNYSFANASYGQMSYQNTSAFQSNMAPSVASGYFTDNQGEISTVYGGEAPIVKQSTSELRTGIFADDTIGKNLQKQVQEAESTLDSVQESYAESVANTGRVAADYVTHCAESSNYSQNVSEREGSSIQDSINYIQTAAENFSRQHGLNIRDGMDVLWGASLAGGIDFQKLFSVKGSIGGNHTTAASRDEMLNSALNVSKNEGFQQNLQKITDYARSQSYTSGNDEGSRESKALCDSIDKMTNIQSSHQNALNHLKQSSENVSWFEQNSQLVKRSLNQDFMKWASGQYAESGGFERVKEILSNDCASEVEPLIRGFIGHMREEQGLPRSVNDIECRFEGFKEDFNARKSKIDEGVNSHADHNRSKVHTDIREKFQNEKNRIELDDKFINNKEGYALKSADTQEKIQGYREKAGNDFESLNEKYLIERVWKGLDKSKNLGDNCKISESPFWLNEEES